jgi:hypothetical protein
MGRQIVTEEDVARYNQQESIQTTPGSVGIAPGVAAAAVRQRTAPKADNYQDRLLKLIPTEVIATYIAVDGVLKSAPSNVPALLLRWVVFVALLFATWFYLERIENVNKRQQLAISTIAFAVWVFSLGGPFSNYQWYSSIYGAVLLPIYTFGVAIVQKRPPEKLGKKFTNGSEPAIQRR